MFCMYTYICFVVMLSRLIDRSALTHNNYSYRGCISNTREAFVVEWNACPATTTTTTTYRCMRVVCSLCIGTVARAGVPWPAVKWFVVSPVEIVGCVESKPSKSLHSQYKAGRVVRVFVVFVLSLLNLLNICFLVRGRLVLLCAWNSVPGLLISISVSVAGFTRW